jgi:hypothetical protein
MKRTLIIVGLVAALAIPTAAVAAGHRSTPKAKSRSVATTPKTKAKGFVSAIRSRRHPEAVEERPRVGEDEGAREAEGGDELGPQAEGRRVGRDREHVGEGSAEQDAGHSLGGRDPEPARRFVDVGEAGDRRHRPPDLDQRGGRLTDQRQGITHDRAARKLERERAVLAAERSGGTGRAVSAAT